MARRRKRRSPWGSLHRRRRRDGSLYPGWFLTYTYHDAEGRSRRTTRRAGATRQEADAYRRSLWAEVADRATLRRRGDVMFMEFLEGYFAQLAQRVSPVTYRTDGAALLRAAEWFGTRALYDITRQDVEHYLAELPGRGRGRLATPRTRARHLHVLRTCFEAAIDEGLLRDNPCRRVKVPRGQDLPVPYLPDALVDRILAAAEPGVRPALRVLSETGMRLGELRQLTWSDVDLGRRRVVVRRSKTRRTREVPLTAAAVAAFAAAAEGDGHVSVSGTAPPPTELVFGGALHQPWTLLRHLRLASAACGVPHLRLHDLRHACATRLVRLGVPLPDVAAWLGHQDPALVARLYGRHQPRDALAHAAAAVEAARREAAATEEDPPGPPAAPPAPPRE